MAAMIESAGRKPRQRTTTYGEVSAERRRASLHAPELDVIVNTPTRKYERGARRELVRPGIEA
jgi:FO synthase